MSRIRIASAAALVAVGAAAAASAQTPISRSMRAVTEKHYLAVLNSAHPAIIAAGEGLGLARATELGARSYANPTLSAVREAPSSDSRQLDLTLSWQLPERSRGHALEAARAGIEAREADTGAAVLVLRLTLRQAYAAWAVAEAEARLLSRHVASLDELATREQQRAVRGESSGLAASRLAIAASELSSRRALATARARAAEGEARGWNGSVAPDAAPMVPTLPPAPTGLFESHPGILGLEAEVRKTALSRRVAARFVASPEVTAGWQRVDNGPGSVSGAIVGVSWPVPLGDRSRAQRSAAEVEHGAARARLETARSRLAARRLAATAAYTELASAAHTADRALDSDRLIAAAEASFSSGETTLTDLLDTLSSIRAAESTSLELHAAALAAHRELESAAGAPLELADSPKSDDEPGVDR
ncbi:MAG: TolC family protein [Acidobacteriota bacterium]|nr:TolC family protein [Acidobacteriota bacterium]